MVYKISMKNYEVSHEYIDILVILYFTMFKLLNGISGWPYI